MPVSSQLASFGNQSGALYVMDLVGDQVTHGYAGGDDPTGQLTSILVLKGSIRASNTGAVFSAGQELLVPFAIQFQVEALEPDTRFFHTLKPE